MTQAPVGWIEKGNKLVLIVKCTDFKQAIELLGEIGDIAESHNHHPDLTIQNYNELLISTTTHDMRALTEKDYVLAQAITNLVATKGVAITEQE